MEWKSLRDLTLGRMETHPRGRLAIGGAQPLTWGQVTDQASLIWGLFADRGLEVGDAIVIATQDESRAFELILSAFVAGVTAVVIDPGSTPQACRDALALTGAKLAFVDGGHPLHQSPIEGVELLRVVKSEKKGGLFKRLLGRRRAKATPSADTYPGLLTSIPPMVPSGDGIDASTLAYVLMTSGTTGRSKGVPITHGQLFVHIKSLCTLFELDASSKLLNGLPFHHADGMVSSIGNTLYAGNILYRPGPFTVPTLPDILDLLFMEEITHFQTVPTVLALIERLEDGASGDLAQSPLKMIVSTGGPLSVALWESTEARFGCPVANLYGLTETGTGGVCSGPWGPTRRIGSLGKAVDMTARVLDEAGVPLGPGALGELALKGPNLFGGYLGEAGVNDGVFTDGFFRTGDLVEMDAEGFISLKGRKKSLIIRGGINVFPEEVTEALLAIDGVTEAVTLGVEDAIFGERVLSCVVLADGADASPESLFGSLQNSLSQEKRPDRILVRERLPRGPAGKVRLGVLRESLNKDALSERGSTEGLEADVLALGAESFRVPVSTLSLTSKAGETGGWDSLAHMQLVAAVEAHFKVKLTTADILRVKTLGALVDCVARLKGEGPR